MATLDSIRDALPVTGRTIILVTCDDFDKDNRVQISKIYLHFDDGSTLSFCIGDTIAVSYDGYPDDHPLVQADNEDGVEPT